MEEVRKRPSDSAEKEEVPPNRSDSELAPNLRYGPMPTITRQQKRFTRYITLVSVAIVVYYYTAKDKERVLASISMSLPQRTMPVTCSQAFSDELSRYSDCVPRSCGRGVYDTMVTQSEVDVLLKLAKKGFALSRPAGGAAILDLHSGALSHGEKFINIYKIPNVHSVFDARDFAVYKEVRTKIQHAIAAQFKISPSSLHLTHPTFFSQLSGLAPRTLHDEYWHSHVDKETYQTFHYTALLYLSDFGTDFEGGRFLFQEPDNSTWAVEPVRGRTLIFTSGAENTHLVERVRSGLRTALTIAFTCDEARAVKDPALPATKPLT